MDSATGRNWVVKARGRRPLTTGIPRWPLVVDSEPWSELGRLSWSRWELWSPAVSSDAEDAWSHSRHSIRPRLPEGTDGYDEGGFVLFSAGAGLHGPSRAPS